MRFTLLIAAAAVLAPSVLACQSAAPNDDDRIYDEGARRAWTWIDRNYRPATGLIRATDHYALVTAWDIGSGLLALYSARELGLLPEADYNVRMTRALRTLQTMALYDSAAYSRFYSAETGLMHGRNERVTEVGNGWSATDLGRLLSALKVVASNHPRFQPAVDSVVHRFNYARLIKDGYLMGEDLRANGRISQYTEGRLGYEQYAAQGFAVWGQRAERALDMTTNARPVTVEGVTLQSDRRGSDRITSEPFILGALELDLWGDPLNQQARGVLAAQEARYRRTHQITMVSEDAIPVAPYHFYYYTVFHDGRPWVIDAQAPMAGVRVARWMSTKAAFAWHALHPSEYTRLALRAVVDGHRGQQEWSSGVYEESGRPTGAPNINTNAVILEAALYRKQGRRLFTEAPAAN